MAATGNRSRIPAMSVVGALLFAALLAGAEAMVVCNVDTKDLDLCRPAVTPVYGKALPDPTVGCCGVMRRADLKCLCKLKSVLSAIKIDPKNAVALPPKCDLETPSECHDA